MSWFDSRQKLGGLLLLTLLMLATALPWVAGQLIAWKVERQLALLDEHPALSLIESEWHSGYGSSRGHAVVAERVGCGVRACAEVRVDFAASHLSSSPLGWGRVVATADLNSIVNYQLNPPVAPLNLAANVGVLGNSDLHVSMSPSWHQLEDASAEALAFSGIDASFEAFDYAQQWRGDVTASFTLLTESASAEQKQRMGAVMQSLGTRNAIGAERMGSVIVRVVVLLKELSTAILVWHDKTPSWQTNNRELAGLDATPLLKPAATANTKHKPLTLELAPDEVVGLAAAQGQSLALQLPSFEAWHGDMPMPPVVQRLGPATYEQEPDLDVWQLQLQFSGDTVTLNGLALWQANELDR
jgi:hypothetical protein